MFGGEKKYEECVKHCPPLPAPDKPVGDPPTYDDKPTPKPSPSRRLMNRCLRGCTQIRGREMRRLCAEGCKGL